MRRRIATIAVLALLAWPTAARSADPGPAGDADGEPVPKLDPEVARVLAKIEEVSEGLRDVKARVVYEESIPLLEKVKRSRGRLTFKKPDKLILELGKPRREDVYTNGELWWVVSHETRQVLVYKAADQEGDAQEAAFLRFAFGGGSVELAKDYRIELMAQNNSEATPDDAETIHQLKFTPRKKAGKPIRYDSIRVIVSDKSWLPHSIVLEETGGEIIQTYNLDKIDRNVGVDDAQFDYKPPKDYAVEHAEPR